MSNLIREAVRDAQQAREDRRTQARALRPAYFEKRDSLLASGAFKVEDRRLTHKPTGRTYAD